MAKFCTECAYPITDKNAQFCVKCGAALPIYSSIVQSTEPQPIEIPHQVQKSQSVSLPIDLQKSPSVNTPSQQSEGQMRSTQTRPAYETNWILILAFIVGLPSIFIPIILFIIVIGSAIAVYYDAEKIGAGRKTGQESTSSIVSWTPMTWGLLVMLLWIIMLPMYLIYRKEIFSS